MRKIRIINLLIVNIFILILLLIMGEISLRILNPNYQLYKRTYPNQCIDHAFNSNLVKVNWPRKDSVLGWVCKNGVNLYFSNPSLNDHEIIYKINKYGFRDIINFETQNLITTKKKVMFLGDSFIFGVYLKEEETIISRLEKNNGGHFSFYNFGIPGYGIDQMYLTFKLFRKIIKPDIIILFYIDNDIPRVSEAYRKIEGMNKPSFEIRNDTLILRKNDKPNLFETILQNSYLFNRFYKWYIDHESIKIVKRIISDLIISTKNNKEELIIIRCPVKEYFKNGTQIKRYSLSDYLKNKSIKYIELYNELNNKYNYNSLYLRKDEHLSAYGALVISNILERLIFK